MVTDNQLTLFDAFGFMVLRGVLRPEELETIGKEFDIGLAEAERATERISNRKQLNWSNLGPETPYLASLLEDPRFLGTASQILGDGVIGQFCNCNSFSGDRTEWHPDVSDMNWRGIKFGFYLQPLDADTGALRFIPGSHKEPLHSDAKKVVLRDTTMGSGDEAGFRVDQVPAYVAVSNPGDVVIFGNNTWHGSWGGGVDRRMCTLGYFASPRTPEEEASVRSHVELQASVTRDLPLTATRPEWIANHGRSLVRQQWIDELRRWGFIENGAS